jgi:hypothetical protein
VEVTQTRPRNPGGWWSVNHTGRESPLEASMTRGHMPIVLAAVLGTGCLVDVHHVSDPGPAFRRAREEALRYQGRGDPVRSVQVLVYEADEKNLVRVGVPLWLAREISHDVDWEDDTDGDTDRLARRLRRHIRWKDLEAARPGLLLEVEEEGGDLVLVWLK